MAEEEIKEAAEKLDVTAEDTKHVCECCTPLKKCWYWIIGAAIAVIAFLVWLFTRGGSIPDGGEGYPYAAAVILPQALHGKSKKSKAAILLGSALVFLIALKAAPVFGQAIKYNVYNK